MAATDLPCVSRSSYDHQRRPEVYCRGDAFRWDDLMELAFNPVFHPEEGRRARDDQVAVVFCVFALVMVTDVKWRVSSTIFSSLLFKISLPLVSQHDDPLSKRFIHLARISMMLAEDTFCSRSLLTIYCIVSVIPPPPKS